MEMVKSVDDLRTPQSIGGHRLPNFEMLDAKVVSPLKKIITTPLRKKRVSLEEQKDTNAKTISPWKTDCFY